MATPSSPEQYGIVLLGRTGQGKSTTANKLLGIGGGPAVWSKVPPEDGRDHFLTSGEGVELDSVTTECKTLSNELNIKVLDTPGFADTKKTKHLGVYKANLQIFRSVLREQEKYDLAFRRVLYFLPNRGPLGKRAEGTLQEEIKVMYEFFGENIFNIMVIIATQEEEYQMYEFAQSFVDRSVAAFTRAFDLAIGKTLERCPPIVYLPLAEENVLSKILAANVIADHHLLRKPDVTEFTTRQQLDALIRNNPVRRLQFQDRCARCADKIVYEFDTTKGERQPVKIIYENGGEVPYEKSRCHPIIIPKHSEIAKIVGGIVHIITLSIIHRIQKAKGKKYVPWFTDTDEICPICKGTPGSDGCTNVGTRASIPLKGGKNGYIETSHSTQLDKIQIVS